jgi:hypothetical protein
MATETTPAAGATPEIDYDKLAGALGKSLEAKLGEMIGAATKPLHETIAKLEAAAQPAVKEVAAEAGKAKALTLEDLSRLIDSKLGAQQQASQQAQARDAFLASKLKDLPAAYQKQLGSDPSKWAAEEQSIRDQYKADFKSAGGTKAPVGGENPGGAAAAQAVDVSKLSPRAKIEAGIKQSTLAQANV